LVRKTTSPILALMPAAADALFQIISKNSH
jgi:hypothetical protein